MSGDTIDFTPDKSISASSDGIDFTPINSTTTQASPKSSMEGSIDANGIYQNPPLINRIASANREALRQVWSGPGGSTSLNDMKEAYQRGRNNPSQSETFQNQLLRTGLIPNQNGTTSTLNSFAGGVAGEMADIVTSPVAAILTAAGDMPLSDITKAIKSVATTSAKPALQQASEIGNAIKSVFQNKFEIPPSEAVGEAQRALPLEKNIARQNLSNAQELEMNQIEADHLAKDTVHNNNLKMLQGQMQPDNPNMLTAPKAADQATLAIRDRFSAFAKDISTRFGKAYRAAIGNTEVSTQAAYDAYGRAIEQSGMLAKSPEQWSASEKAIYDEQQSLKSKLPGTSDTTHPILDAQGRPIVTTAQTGQNTIPLEDLDKSLRSILGDQAGTQYGQGEHILTLARENLANAVGNTSKALRQVGQIFAPELQAKNALYDIAQPFNQSGKFDTSKGVQFFSKYANGKMTDPSSLRLISAIENSPKLGRDITAPLDSVNLQRNAILRQKAALLQDTADKGAAVTAKYQGLNNQLNQENLNNSELLRHQMTMAQINEAKPTVGQKIKTVGKVALRTGEIGGAIYGGYKWLTRK